MRILLLTIAFLAPASHANTMPSEHQSMLSAIQHLAVHFTQTTFRPIRKTTRTRSGMAWFAKPGSFKWEFSPKSKQTETWFFNGTKLSHYLALENTVTHYGTKGGIGSELKQVVKMVLDPGTLLSKYSAQQTQDSAASKAYLLKPKGKSSIESIEIVISKAQKFVSKVAIQYANGEKSSYSFSSPNKSPIKKTEFEFQKKPGVKEKTLG